MECVGGIFCAESIIVYSQLYQKNISFHKIGWQGYYISVYDWWECMLHRDLNNLTISAIDQISQVTWISDYLWQNTHWNRETVLLFSVTLCYTLCTHIETFYNVMWKTRSRSHFHKHNIGGHYIWFMTLILSEFV